MSEKGGVTRRDFLKMSVAALIPKEIIKFGNLNGDFVPDAELISKITSFMAGETLKLPEVTIDNREWKQMNPENSPPGCYRAASCWSQERESFILHGGWTGSKNHNQTWEFKNNNWIMLEEGSTPGLHGHKMVDTPEGLIMFGGLVVSTDGSSSTPTNKFYKFDNEISKWEEIIPVTDPGWSVPETQGMGMVYDEKSGAVWIAGGINFQGDLTDLVGALYLPKKGYRQMDDWFYTGKLNLKHQLFEPLLFTKPEEEGIFLYGGEGYDLGGGRGLYSNEMWKMQPVANTANSTLEQVPIPFVDYGGAVRGGFIKNDLFLDSGRSVDFFGVWGYRESVILTSNNEWKKQISEGARPMSRPSESTNPDGIVLRFGGGYYDDNKHAVWSNETWMCKPKFKIFLPEVSR